MNGVRKGCSRRITRSQTKTQYSKPKNNSITIESDDSDFGDVDMHECATDDENVSFFQAYYLVFAFF